MTSRPFDMAFFGRACRGEYYSGDLALTHEKDSEIFFAVTDAAGHGRSAHLISNKIELVLRETENTDLEALVIKLHESLKGTSGAVLVLGVIDTTSMDLNFIMIGDTHGKILGPKRRSLAGQAGMLGNAIPTPIVRTETLVLGDILVLCTDGVSERYEIATIQGYKTLSAKDLAREVVEQFGKDHDDATCLVLRHI